MDGAGDDSGCAIFLSLAAFRQRVFHIKGETLTELTPGDLPAITGLYERCAEFLAIDPAAGPPSSVFVIPDDALPERHHVFGIWKESRLDGVLAVLRGYREAKDWWIGLLLLDPSQRGNGLGSRVVDSVLAWARESGVAETIWIAVAPRNEKALRFWRGRGFVDRNPSGQHLLLSRGID